MNPFTQTNPVPGRLLSVVELISDQTTADASDAVPQRVHPNSTEGGFLIGCAFLRTTTVADLTLPGGNVSAGDTLTVSGVTYTFVAGTPSSGEIQIGTSVAITLSNIAAQINTDTAILQATASASGSTCTITGVSPVTPVQISMTTTGSVHNITYTNGSASATLQMVTYVAEYQRYAYNSTISLTANGCVEFVAHVGARPVGFIVTSLSASAAISVSAYIATGDVGRP